MLYRTPASTERIRFGWFELSRRRIAALIATASATAIYGGDESGEGVGGRPEVRMGARSGCHVGFRSIGRVLRRGGGRGRRQLFRSHYLTQGTPPPGTAVSAVTDGAFRPVPVPDTAVATGRAVAFSVV